MLVPVLSCAPKVTWLGYSQAPEAIGGAWVLRDPLLLRCPPGIDEMRRQKPSWQSWVSNIFIPAIRPTRKTLRPCPTKASVTGNRDADSIAT